MFPNHAALSYTVTSRRSAILAFCAVCLVASVLLSTRSSGLPSTLAATRRSSPQADVTASRSDRIARNPDGRIDSGSGSGIGSGSDATLYAPATVLPEHYVFLEDWSGGLPAPGLRHPEGIDIGPSGRIYVAEMGNHRVSVWSLSGDRVGTWGSRGAGIGAFEAPEDVALDPERSRLYVADTGNSRVQVIDTATGSTIDEWAGLGKPRGIAVAPDGTVYVADAERHIVRTIGPDGSARGSFGGGADGLPSADSGRLDTPLGVSVDASGNIYVADNGNQRIQWFDPSGAVLGSLALENAAAGGGAPFDVGVDGEGTVHVAVERGVLRFTGGRASGALTTLSPLREDYVPGVTRCGSQRIVPVEDNQEGVRRLAIRPGVGLVFTYAPELRVFDRIITHPERGFEDVIPSLACGDATISSRHLYDPHRLDIGDAEHYLHVLDRSNQLRVFRSDGRWYDTFHSWPSGGGIDISTDRSVPYHSNVLEGNAVGVSSLACFLGCGPERVSVLDSASRTRRNRIGERIPDAGWWNTAVAVDTSIATLNTGYAQIVIRDGFPCGPPSIALPCTDRACNRSQTCDPAPARLLLGVVPLLTTREPFISFRDVAHDARGRLWVLARDGQLRALDRFGRAAGEVTLNGLGVQAAESFAVDIDGAFFVLTTDERVHKFSPDGSALAEWSVDELAGAGRYLDIAVDDDGTVNIPDADGDRIVRFVQGTSPAPVPTPRGGKACRVEVDKVASPTRLRLGETTEVTLGVEVECPTQHAALDIVLVFDGSCQMSGRRLANARAAGLRLLESIDLSFDRIAVVTFSDEIGGARLIQRLTDDREALSTALAGLRNECLPPFLAPDRGADGRIAEGLRVGREALRGPIARVGAGTVLALFSPSLFDRGAIYASGDGASASSVGDRDHSIREARKLWSNGTRVYAFGVDEEVETFPDLALSAGSDPPSGEEPSSQRPTNTPAATNTPLPPRATATSPRPGATPTATADLRSVHPSDHGLLASIVRPADGYFHAESSSALPDLYGDLGSDLADRPFLRLLVVEDEIPADMRLIPGSVNPPADMPSPAVLRWTFRDVGPDGPPPLTYTLEPLETGLRPTNVRAEANYIDGMGVTDLVIFPIPVVEVYLPSPTPEATVEPTSTPHVIVVTPTEEPSATPSQTPTPRPSATRSIPGPPVPIYLPWSQRDVCVPKVRPVDIAILIDTSSSMNGAKIDAARSAASTFVSLLDLPRDRAAIITFDARASRVQDLVGDRGLLDAAIRSVRTAVGTRIDRGLWEALETVAGAERRIEADPIIVLLTDGQTEAGSEDDMFLIAELAADAGVTIYAIGLGLDVPIDALTRIAGGTDRVYLAPSAAAVAGIYERVAQAIPCR